MNRKTKYSALPSLLKVIVIVALFSSSNAFAGKISSPQSSFSPQAILQEYLKAVYSRDAKAAYNYLSQEDKSIKQLDEYAGEISPFSGNALRISQALAEEIEFQIVRADVAGPSANVTFDVILPNANHSEVNDLVVGFDNDRLNRFTENEIDSLLEKLETLKESGSLPVLHSKGETRQLLLENGAWRVFENWANAVKVTFTAKTSSGLGWEFFPKREFIMAKHGETLTMNYVARNIASVESTGKAHHIIDSGFDSDYLELVSCFCFLEQTLSPGESTELPLVFRVKYDAPDALKQISVEYDFYPYDQFPDDFVQTAGQR